MTKKDIEKKGGHLLVIDDDDRLLELLRRYLSENGFYVSTASSAAKARELLKLFVFDLIILDVMMPEEDGFSFLKSFRKTNEVPVLMLTAMNDLKHKIQGLEEGADDYLLKPFEPKELLLRIKSILKRAKPAGVKNKIKMGELTFDKDKEELIGADKHPVKLSASEKAVLKRLAEKIGTIVSREELAVVSNNENAERNVDVLLTRLRKKIEPDIKRPLYLHTVRGKGYKLLV